jgi:hypothetical protein
LEHDSDHNARLLRHSTGIQMNHQSLALQASKAGKVAMPAAESERDDLVD